MSEQSIAFDSVLDTCQNQHRRIVLKMLIEEQRALTLNELTKIVFKHSYQAPITEVSENILTRIHVSLYQLHLPKLAAEGLINYDPEKEFVEPTEQLEQMQPTLSTILDADPSVKAPIAL